MERARHSRSGAHFPWGILREPGIALGLLLSASCTSVEQTRYGANAIEEGSELLKEAREVTRQQGLVDARNLVAERLKEADASDGVLERRVIETTRDFGQILPDSLAALPAGAKRRIALIIIPGTETGFGGPSKTRLTLREAARVSEEMGFSTHFIDTPPRGEVADNASLVADRVAPLFDEVDHVIMLALSKGAHDLVHYLQEHGAELSEEKRRKLKLVLSLGGTLQGSVVADYFANAPHLIPVTMRMLLVVRGDHQHIATFKTVARTPWQPDKAGRMGELFPHLTWVSLAMIPDGEDGRISEKLWSPVIRRRISHVSPYFSPADGLVESAASVLPDEVEVTQWVVRAFGSHSMPNGRYVDGSRVAPRTTTPGDETLKPVSGGEVMSAYLRALPWTLLSGGGQ